MNKKLYRATNGRILCGVCAGIAEFLNVDPNVIRVLWILFACLGGTGIVAYILVAILLPENPMTIK